MHVRRVEEVFMRRSALFLGASLIVVAPIAGTALHFGAEGAAHAEFARLSANLDGLTAESVTADAWLQKMTVDGLAFSRAGFRVRVGRIALPLAMPRSIFTSVVYAQDAAAAPSSISAENVAIDVGAVHYAIKRIDLSGTSLAKSDLDAILDPKSALSAADRIGKLLASHINIPEIVVQTTLSGQSEKDTYRDIALDDVVQGHVANAAIGSLSSTLISSTANTMQSASGPIKMTGVDLALAARIVSEPRQSDSEPLKTLYDSVDIEGGKIFGENSNVEIGIGAILAKDVKARRLRIPLRSVAGMFASQAKPTNNQQAASYLADVLDSFELGSVELKDLRFTSFKDKAFTATLGRIYLHQMAASKISEIGYENFAVESGGTTVKIGGINFHDINLGELRDLFAKAAKNSDSASIDATAAVPAIGHISLGDIDVDVDDSNANVAGGDSHTKFQISKFDLTNAQPVNGAPTHLVTSLDHFTIDLKSLNGAQLGGIADLGYDKLDMSSRIEARFDASKKEVGLDDFSVSGVEMGAVKIAATFGNVTTDLFSADGAQVEAAALSILIRRLEIRIENAGLVDRLVAAAAKRDKISPAEMREKYVSTAAISVPATLGNGPGAKAIGAAIAKFVAAPKNLRIVAVDPEGFGIADFVLLRDPTALMDRLSIEAAANE